jgi:hypothetical protein
VRSYNGPRVAPDMTRQEALTRLLDLLMKSVRIGGWAFRGLLNLPVIW